MSETETKEDPLSLALENIIFQKRWKSDIVLISEDDTVSVNGYNITLIVDDYDLINKIKSGDNVYCKEDGLYIQERNNCFAAFTCREIREDNIDERSSDEMTFRLKEQDGDKIYVAKEPLMLKSERYNVLKVSKFLGDGFTIEEVESILKNKTFLFKLRQLVLSGGIVQYIHTKIIIRGAHYYSLNISVHIIAELLYNSPTELKFFPSYLNGELEWIICRDDDDGGAARAVV